VWKLFTINVNIFLEEDIFKCYTTNMDLNVIVPVILFVLLTPGVLLALPPGQSLLIQSVTHAVVFGVVYTVLRQVFPQYY
jgi:hypothetical protein